MRSLTTLGRQVVDGVDAAQWRLLGGLWVLGGSLAVAASALGLGPTAHPRGAALAGTGAVLAGVVVWALAARLPVRWIGWVLAAGTTSVSLASIAGGSAGSPFVLFYCWVGVEAWYFLSYRGAALYTAYAVALSGAVALALPRDDGAGLSWWLVLVGSLVAISSMSAALRLRSDRLVARLRELAVHDELTGVLNRRGLHERLGEELARSRRDGSPLAVVVCDLDRFKALNDRHGHAAGDEALRAFAAVCVDVLRGIDVVGRVGGEELVLVLPGVGEAAGRSAAGRIAAAARRRVLDPDGAPVTASFGIAAHPGGPADLEALLRAADAAMYAAKAAGRDRVAGAGDALALA